MQLFLIVYCGFKKFSYICIKKQVQHLLKQHIMETYNFKFGSVRVIDCANYQEGEVRRKSGDERHDSLADALKHDTFNTLNQHTL